MAKENTEVIYVQLDTSQVEDSVSRVAAVLEDLESTVNRLGENISSAFSGLLQIPNTISSIESVGAVFGNVLPNIGKKGKYQS